MSTSRVFVVTGSNKGIGFATVKALCKAVGDQSVVYLTARSAERGNKAVEDLAKDGLHPRFHLLDIDDTASIESFANFLKKEHGGLDVLVNNAATAFKNDAKEPFGEQAEITMRVNYFAHQAVCKALFPLLRPHARVVNISSSLGHLTKVPGEQLRKQLADPALTEPQLDQIVRDFVKAAAENKHEELGWLNSAYAASKVVMSALTPVHQRQLDQDKSREDVIVNHCHPGYVDTDMTSHRGILSPDQGAVCPTYLALLPPNTSAGGEYFWHDKQKVDWVNGPLPAPGY